MFRKYPYWGWLLISVVLWSVVGYDYQMHTAALTPQNMAGVVSRDINSRQTAISSFLQKKRLIEKIFSDSLSPEDVALLNNQPFFLFAYDRDTLKYWNTNDVVATFSDSTLANPAIIRNDAGVFVERSWEDSTGGCDKRLVLLVPVIVNYPLENDYLKSHFVAAPYIPAKTKITSAGSGALRAYPVALRNGTRLFSLSFNMQDIQKWPPDTLFVIVLLAALFTSLSWIQLLIIRLTSGKMPATGFFITLILIAVLRILLFVYGLPFNLESLTFFSPALYAYSKYLSSFGDLFIDIVCCLWLVLFIVRHTRYKYYFSGVRSLALRYVFFAALSVALQCYLYLFVTLIRSLVLDSNISFDINHFYAISLYSILGLFLISVVTGISCVVIYLLNIQLNILAKGKIAKYLAMALVSAACLVVLGRSSNGLYWILSGCFLLFVILLDQRRLAPVSDLLEPHMIFWAVIICTFTTGLLQYFNEIKEKEQRKAFVEQRLLPIRDNEMEYSFNKFAGNIQKDKALKSFLLKPSVNGRKTIGQHFDASYITGPLSKYQSKVYLFDAQKRSLYNRDSANYSSLLNEEGIAIPTVSPNLFYRESVLDRPFYLSFIPVYADSSRKLLGYVIIDLDQKKQVSETVYPELLQPAATRANPQEAEYSYAVYINGKLITQTNNYPFPTSLKDDTLKDQSYVFHNADGTSELYYKISDRRTIVVAYAHSQFLELTSVFSYLFGVQVILAVLIILYQLYLSYLNKELFANSYLKLTLRKRVHFSILIVVLISFVIVGLATIGFFQDRYKTSTSVTLQSAMQVAKQSVRDYLKRAHASKAGSAMDSVVRSAQFKYFITGLAAAQKIDINIFNDEGSLYNTSEDEIYNKGLLSHMMRPDAFYQLNDLGKSIVIQDEQVAGLSYLSAYEPLRDEQGVTLGYINVPFFSSEKDLNFQISNIVVTLINLYAFIFLFSSLLTVFIARWITRSFGMIIKQFGRLNLQRNERIKWPHNDEISLLVNEYNKMLIKVEENAAILAQSEREGAWREMARQVAHEIKNPLTPMKLNIQYLQQAIKADSPGIKELTNKVSVSIIEQIDNLSYIASEFSNFAKMPEARPEEIELNDMLHRAVELYMDEAAIKVTFNAFAANLFVYADRSQLLRVFTNLLENAKQAIPADRQGRIHVALVKEGDNARITITDNGAGIPEDVTKKIFQPYFTTKNSGTGLGLAMTRKIIEFWKGTIWFETDEGNGTVFYIQLPLLSKQ